MHRHDVRPCTGPGIERVEQPSSVSDVTLAIRAAADGSEDAFVAVWKAYQPRLLRFLHPLVTMDDAPDIASAVWVDVV